MLRLINPNLFFEINFFNNNNNNNYVGTVVRCEGVSIRFSLS